MSYLKGFFLGIALWLGVLILVFTGLRTDDNRPLLVAAAVVAIFLLTWRRLWRRRRWPASRREPIPTALRRHVYARDGFRCVFCGRKGRRILLTIDHVFPVALGGTNDVGNLVTACRACNLTKGAPAQRRQAPALHRGTARLGRTRTAARLLAPLGGLPGDRRDPGCAGSDRYRLERQRRLRRLHQPQRRPQRVLDPVPLPH
ncbi:MAG TPA: HNH endonuclease signature motif containing protein [Thermomicrobiales bacterium]|nr:HNH endonuclease signature motif containing protein [Thermomicrobiales bacterium]